MNTISVIIPAYNCENTISKCLNSLLSQTYGNFEIIVVDDGSEDKTGDIVLNFTEKDKRVKLICQKNSGVSAARNCGIKRSSGKLLAFVDSDDYVSDTYLEELFDLYSPGVVPVVNFSRNNSKYGVLPLSDGNCCRKLSDNIFQDYFAGKLGKAISFSACNKLFEKHIITENQLEFNINVKIGEDMIFVFQYLNYCAAVKICGKPLYHYCARENSAVNSDKCNFAPLYEDTFNSILLACKAKAEPDMSALAYWSLTVVKYTLSNRYVTSQSYAGFSVYFKYIISLSFVNCAKSCTVFDNARDRILKFALNRKKPPFLFLVVKINCAVQKIKRGIKG